MPDWIEKTKSGTLICALCGSLIVQDICVWSCSHIHCVKHADLPVEQQRHAGLIFPESTVGTASVVSTSLSPSEEIGEADV